MKTAIIIAVLVLAVAAAVSTGGLFAGASGLAAGAITLGIIGTAALGAAAGLVLETVILGAVGLPISFIVNSAKSPYTRAKVKEYCELLNPINAVTEIVVLIAEAAGKDEQELQKIRLIARIIFTVAFFALLILSSAMGAIAISSIVAISGIVSGVFQMVQAAYTLFTLEKQENVAKRRLELETAIAYCEKLQKDLDIIASEIDMIVELFTAAMDKIRAEYDRISRMIKETSNVKNMIARNIGA